VSSNGDQERTPGAALAVCPCRRPRFAKTKRPLAGPLASAGLVYRAAVMYDVRVATEEALRIRVGLTLMECSGQSAYDDRHAYDYWSHFSIFSLIYIRLASWMHNDAIACACHRPLRY
jgi:hypothetical protein